MAAPKGNHFWELRSKHGRDKIFATPELMWEAACEYFVEISTNDITKNDFKGKDAVEVFYTLKRPFLISGLCLYLGVNEKYFNDFQDGIKDKDDDLSKGFSYVITRIRDIVKTQKLEGAMVGLFNPTLTAKLAQMPDKEIIRETKEKVVNIGSFDND